ncbi:MAG TPA: glycoside hydrolase family 2 TIM barrel-domain containing protein, partial [Desulfuromonadaceae bacterium]|nr:glycoside hydrolase family 2 TIM barrel-domain containing protein [Desulfuromonadaceae bacterium]
EAKDRVAAAAPHGLTPVDIMRSTNGADITSIHFKPADWHNATVPTTVLGALADDGVYRDIFFGTNLAKIPAEPFKGSWWFRKEFNLNGPQVDGNAELIFEGINYRANIWLNGERIASANEIFGAYRTFKIDVTGRLRRWMNVLAVEVFPPKPGDFTMGFVDWNPQPPDRGMGLFRPVKLHLYKAAGLGNVFVQSKIDPATWRKAALTIHADIDYPGDLPVHATVRGEIGSITVSEDVTLHQGRQAITLSPDKHPELSLDQAQLWWPWELGSPRLYDLKLSVVIEGQPSDTVHTRFGIREVSDYISPEGYRGYMINGKKLLIRGGGWADELLLREDAKNLQAQIQYAKAMNLNTIRLEGFWGSSQQLYDLADENGMLVMPGFSCQWEWEDYLGKKCDEKFGGFKTAEDMQLATNYLHDQVVWLRNHPSIFVWVLGSDKLPRPALETNYDALLKAIDPTRPTLKSCGSVTSDVSGPSAVKMNGPYDYVTPNYWYLDQTNGGAFGFNTETGPGPQPPTLETLKRMLPADHLWPIDDVWNYHAGRHEFAQMNRYLAAFASRYGAPVSADEFAFKAQAANYEAIRPMFEAFAVNAPHTTGIIQWMLNPSWPKLYWQLYDYYLVPGGAYFGAKHGAAPVNLIYNYGDQGIYLVNQSGELFFDYHAAITVYDLNSKVILDQTVATNCSTGPHKIFDMAGAISNTPVYFVDLNGTSEFGPEASAHNFYWLSSKPDVLDEGRTEWFVTPNQSFANFTALDRLPEATVKPVVSYKSDANETTAEVTLKNDGDKLAFFIEMRIVGKGTDQSITPVFWDDNYVSLPPHTTKTFHARFPKGQKPELKVRGWNVKFEFPKS